MTEITRSFFASLALFSLLTSPISASNGLSMEMPRKVLGTKSFSHIFLVHEKMKGVAVPENAWPKYVPSPPPKGYSLAIDYEVEIVKACTSGDMKRGRKLVKEFNSKNKAYGKETNLVFDDLFLLAKIIQKECGADRLDLTWKMKTGNVLLNRVESPEFPNTLKECVYQRNPVQYSNVTTDRFKKLKPEKTSAIAALKLYMGERPIKDKSVVFQSNSPKGSGIYEVLRDEKFGNTYLCYSYHPNLYK